MTGFKELEREYAAAMARLAESRAQSTAPQRRRMPRTLTVVALVVGCGLVGTSAAAVAGLDPWDFLRANDAIDPRRSPVEDASGVVTLASGNGGTAAWRVRAYRTTSFGFCLAGGVSSSSTPGRVCDAGANVIEQLVGGAAPGVYAAARLVDQPEGLPRVLVYGVAAEGVSRIEFAGAETASGVSPSTTGLTIKRDPTRIGGLTLDQARRLAALPTSAKAFPFAAVITATDLGGHAPSASARRVDAGDVAISLRPSASVAGPSAGSLDGNPAPVDGISPVQARALPAFSRLRDADDRVPPTLGADLKANGAQPRLSQRLTVIGNAPSVSVWALPASNHVCLQSSESDLTLCIPDRFLGRLGLTGVVCSEALKRDERLIWGFVPPGTEAVRVKYEDGRTAELPAGDLLALRLTRTAPLVKSISWRADDRWREVPSPLPTDASRDQCG